MSISDESTLLCVYFNETLFEVVIGKTYVDLCMHTKYIQLHPKTGCPLQTLTSIGTGVWERGNCPPKQGDKVFVGGGFLRVETMWPGIV